MRYLILVTAIFLGACQRKERTTEEVLDAYFLERLKSQEEVNPQVDRGWSGLWVKEKQTRKL